MTIKILNKDKIKLLNSDDVYGVMQNLLLREQKIDQEKEHFWIIGLDNANRVLYIELVSMGSVKVTSVEPMNVYRVGVLKGAVKVIFVHNHPSGELKPSDADLDVTDRLIQVGRILNIEAIDHLIISKKSYLSFADTGLFEKLKQSTKWVPQYELVARIKAEEKSIREQQVKEAVQKTINQEEKKRVREAKAAEAEKYKALKDAEAQKLKEVKGALEKGIHAVKIAEEVKLKELKKAEEKRVKGLIEVAKQLKQRKLPLKEIIAITGLSKGEIEKIK
jgi:DNA repair protein RadC